MILKIQLKLIYSDITKAATIWNNRKYRVRFQIEVSQPLRGEKIRTWKKDSLLLL